MENKVKGQLVDFLRDKGVKGKITIASAPGRADFLNTHQDYKGLPVVSAGLRLRTYVGGKAVRDDKIIVRSLNLEDDAVDEFQLQSEYGTGFGNYVRAVVNVLRKRGKDIGGVHMVINSEVPIAAGLGSSAALELAVVKFFDSVFDLNLLKNEMAEIAYTAEHDELKIPCGRLDQYGSSYGGIIKLETRPPFNVEQLPFKGLFFTIINSGVKHRTASIHPVRQKEVNDGLKELMTNPQLPDYLKMKLGYNFDSPAWDGLNEEDVMPYLENLDDKSKKRILFTLRMHRSTEHALEILRRKKFSRREFETLGNIVNYQHELLRDFYDVSLPVLEKIRDAALDAGSYGVKISGAGLGGCLIALVKDLKTAEKVMKAGIGAGAAEGWVSDIGTGATAEKVDLG